MLQVSNLSKRFGDTLLFEGANFILNAGDHVGLVGPNGCGKTTLLRLLMGELPPDAGSVSLAVPRFQIGYLPQALEYTPEATVAQALRGSPELDQEHWAHQVQTLAARLAQAGPAEAPSLERAYTEALDRLSFASTRLPEHAMTRVLAGLDLAELSTDTPVRILSGGQKTRLGLARLLLDNPSLLLLDEPTNHLDITALEWLEGYLSNYQGAMLIVSHDRTFLDNTVNHILEINPTKHTLTLYEGNYSAYLATKEREEEKYALAYKNQEARLGRLQAAIRGIKGQALNIEHETINFYYRKQAKKIARRAIVQQRRLQRMVDSEEHLEKPGQHWEMKLEFIETPPSGQDVLILEGLGKHFGALCLFDDVNLVLRRQERIALLGPNGSGKTTLLRMIVGEEAPSVGMLRIGANVRVGYFSQEQDRLDWSLTPFEIVRREAALDETDARSFLHLFLFAGDDVFTPLAQLSYGERARLALGLLVLQGCNLLLLDEPINHLDIPSRERFEHALRMYEGTVLSVVHDRFFVQRFATGVWAIREGTIRRYADLADLRQADRQ